MRIIGITGGIGTGKSTILNILHEEMGAYVLEADRVAHELMQPGHSMYEQIVKTFSTPGLTESLVLENQTINRDVLGALVFSDAKKLKQLNAIVHPAVKQYILSAIEKKQSEGCPLFVIEAALLIEDGYNAICDELWYIYSSEDVRIRRLMEGRGYTLEKCKRVMQNQSDEEFYRKYCAHVIDNSGYLEDAKKQVKELLKTL